MTSTSIYERSSIFTLDQSTIDDVNAPEDELLGTTTKSAGQIKQQEQQQRRSDSDESRVPPPIDASSSSPSSPVHHQDFASWNDWKRDIDAMTDVLKNKKSTIQITDRKTARINKRRQMELSQQIQHAQSDIGAVNRNTFDYDDQASLESTYSSSMLDEGTLDDDDHHSSPVVKNIDIKKSRSLPVFVAASRSSTSVERKLRRGRYGAARRQRYGERHPATLKTVASTISPTTSLRRSDPPNANELAAIMFELADLKVWATTATAITTAAAAATANTTTISNNPSPRSPFQTPISWSMLPSPLSTPLSSPFSSPKKERQPLNNNPSPRSPSRSPVSWSVLLSPLSTPLSSPFSSPKKQRQPLLPSSATNIDSNERSNLMEDEQQPQQQQQQQEEQQKKQKKKSVQFTHPLTTDTIYRPYTPREEVNNLFFQEEELLDWEYDEETTVRDRFEIVVEVIDDTTDEIASPIISFHNSYSYSSEEDDCSYDYENEYSNNNVGK